MIPFVRRLTGLHDAFLYAALSLGFVAIITGHSTPWWLLVGFPVGMVAGHLFYRAQLADPSQNRWWNALILVVAAGLFVEYLLNPLIDVMIFGVQFVLVLILIKLFSRQGPRDELQIYALSFLIMGAASTLNEDFTYGILFGLYVLCATFGLALFHLKTEAGRQSPARSPNQSPFDRLYVGVLVGISILILASSLVIFFAFPRIGLGLFADPSRDSISITGFSDNVEVGDHGSVRDNPSVVMRVEFDGGRPDDIGSLRWRTMTFDTYDGSGWTRALGDADHTSLMSSSGDHNLHQLYTPTMRQTFDDDKATTVEIYLEPLGVNVLPTLWPTSELNIEADDAHPLLGTNAPSLTHDDYGDLRHTLSNDVGLSYGLRVQPSPPAEVLRRQSGRELNPADADRYLQLPDAHPEVVELAEEWTADADSNYEKAEAVGRRFVEEFQYTLDLPEITTDDPVAEFLIEHRAGHCEYFATAAAVLLRSTGVPTRLVNGFLGGTWNDIGDYLTVRHGDAHAWIEVFVPELGWVPFDPTPPIESTFLGRAGITQMVSDTVDAMRHAWLVWFLEYDLDTQLELLRDIGHAVGSDGGDYDVETDDDEPQRDPLPIRPFLFWGGWLLLGISAWLRGRTYADHRRWKNGVTLFAGLAAGGLWVGWFQGWEVAWTFAGAVSVGAIAVVSADMRSRQQAPDLRLATRLFQTIERSGRSADLARLPGEGPGTYLERLATDVPAAQAALKSFRSIYLDVRFGGQSLSDEKRRRLRRAAQAIRSALRRH